MIDFLWKSPNFISAEMEREREKLWAYFPDRGSVEERERNADLRKIRAHLEGRKLFGHFPHYLAQSNLYLVLSLFERHLLCIAHLQENKGRPLLSEVKGSGVDRYLRFLKLHDIKFDKIPWYHEVQAVKSIRNCMLHAGGELALSRDRTFVEQVVGSELYKPPARRGDEGMIDDYGRPEIEIKEGRLLLNWYFPIRAEIATAEYLYELVEAIPPALGAAEVPYLPA